MKLQYLVNISAVANFHMMMVSINKNVLEQARITLQLYVSKCRAGGKPSIGFPPGTRRAEISIAIICNMPPCGSIQLRIPE